MPGKQRPRRSGIRRECWPIKWAGYAGVVWPRIFAGFSIRAFLKEPKEFQLETPLHKALNLNLSAVSPQGMRL